MVMSRNNEAQLEEARLLLPWYLTGQLSAVERELVDKALSQYPYLQDELHHEEQIKKLVCQDAQLLALSALDTTPQRLENLLRRIGREDEQPEVNNSNAHLARPVTAPATPRPTQPNRWTAWWQSLWSAEWLTPANAVLAGLLVCQGGVGIAYFSYNHYSALELAQNTSKKGEFELSSYCTIDNISINLEQNEYLALVEFKESTTVGQVRAFLDAHTMGLVHDAPAHTPNLFLVRFQTELSDDKQIANYLSQVKLASTDTINFLGRATPEEACN